jgi:hypothetical protein
MNLLDFGVMMTQIMYRPNQAVARAHSGTKDGGHAPHLRAPGGAPQAAPEAHGGTEAPAEGSEDQNAASEAQAAPQAPAAPAATASAAPAQG